MKAKRSASFFLTVSFCMIVIFTGQSCKNSNGESQLPREYLSSSPCESYSRESLMLFNNNVPSMIKLAEQMDAGYDPNALEVLSALSFAYQVSEYEEKIKAECPESFKLYEQDRNNLLAFHGLKTLVRYFTQSN